MVGWSLGWLVGGAILLEFSFTPKCPSCKSQNPRICPYLLQALDFWRIVRVVAVDGKGELEGTASIESYNFTSSFGVSCANTV